MLRLFAFLLPLLGGSPLLAQAKVFPIVPSFGGIYAIPEATIRADKEMNYRIVADVLTPGGSALELAVGLENVARLINLHGVDGVPKERLDVVVVLHGEVTFACLKDGAYTNLFGRSNPNVDLIRELTIAGVQLRVCGQSLRARGIDARDVLREVSVATSMLTAVTTLQQLGYHLLKL